jgi:hypothetical protein
VRAARERSLRHLTRVLARLGWLAAAAVATAASWFDLGGVVRPAATWLAGHLDLLPDAVADRVRDLLAADTTQRMLGAGALAALAAAAYRATAVPVGRAWDRRACERQAARRPTLRSLDLVPLAATVALAWVGAVAAAVHRGGTWPAWALGAGIWCIALLALPLSIDRMERAALTGPRTARGRSRRGP